MLTLAIVLLVLVNVAQAVEGVRWRARLDCTLAALADRLASAAPTAGGPIDDGYAPFDFSPPSGPGDGATQAA